MLQRSIRFRPRTVQARQVATALEARCLQLQVPLRGGPWFWGISGKRSTRGQKAMKDFDEFTLLGSEGIVTVLYGIIHGTGRVGDHRRIGSACLVGSRRSVRRTSSRGRIQQDPTVLETAPRGYV